MPYKRGTKWVGQVRKTENEQEYRREKKFDTKKEALEWEAEMRRLSLAEWGVSPNQIPTVSLGDWATKYLDFAKIKFQDKVYREKRSCFREFFKVIPHGTPVEDLTMGMVLTHLQEQVKVRSGHAANKDRKNLVAAWNWGIKYMGLSTLNPCLVDRFAEEKQRRYVPSEADFWKVYDAAEDGQDKLMLMTYLHTAARRSELFRLSWQDVDFGSGTITLSTRKRADGSLEYDALPMTDELYNLLFEHKQTAPSTEWVFINPVTEAPFVERKLWMGGLCKRAGVKAFGLHAIRHLTASILAREGISSVDIQAILRHKKLTTTERYLHRLNDLKPALRVLPKSKSRQAEPSPSAKRPSVLEVVK